MGFFLQYNNLLNSIRILSPCNIGIVKVWVKNCKVNVNESNRNNIKNTWKGITSLITLKDISTTVPRTLNHNNKTVTNPVEIANIFNKHFVSVAEKTRAYVNYSHKDFSESIEINSSNSFFLSPT